MEIAKKFVALRLKLVFLFKSICYKGFLLLGDDAGSQKGTTQKRLCCKFYTSDYLFDLSMKYLVCGTWCGVCCVAKKISCCKKITFELLQDMDSFFGAWERRS